MIVESVKYKEIKQSCYDVLFRWNFYSQIFVFYNEYHIFYATIVVTCCLLLSFFVLYSYCIHSQCTFEAKNSEKLPISSSCRMPTKQNSEFYEIILFFFTISSSTVVSKFLIQFCCLCHIYICVCIYYQDVVKWCNRTISRILLLY